VHLNQRQQQRQCYSSGTGTGTGTGTGHRHHLHQLRQQLNVAFPYALIALFALVALCARCSLCARLARALATRSRNSFPLSSISHLEPPPLFLSVTLNPPSHSSVAAIRPFCRAECPRSKGFAATFTIWCSKVRPHCPEDTAACAPPASSAPRRSSLCVGCCCRPRCTQARHFEVGTNRRQCFGALPCDC
jgi:hypothetical protein